MDIIEFVNEKKFSNVPIVLMPIIIVLAAFEIPLAFEKNAGFTDTIFTIGLLIAMAVDFVLMLKVSFYKVVGTNKRLYIMKFAKTEIVDLVDIKSVSFAQNQKGYYDYSLFTNEKRYQLIINKREEFVEYLKENAKKELNHEKVEENSLVSIILFPEILFVVCVNSLPISFFVMKILSINYYDEIYRMASLYWIVILCIVPCLVLIVFYIMKKNHFINDKKYLRIPLIYIIFIIVFACVTAIIRNVSNISYDKIYIDEIEYKVGYEFPDDSLFETDLLGIKTSVVTVKDKKKFYEEFDSIKRDSLWLNEISSNIPNDITRLVKEADYYLIYSVGEAKYNDSIILNNAEELIIIAVSESQNRFFIYDFYIN